MQVEYPSFGYVAKYLRNICNGDIRRGVSECLHREHRRKLKNTRLRSFRVGSISRLKRAFKVGIGLVNYIESRRR